jgi:hypothetical protein
LLVGTLLLSGQFHGNSPIDPNIEKNGGASRDLPQKIQNMHESLEQPPDGPTRMRFDFDMF